MHPRASRVGTALGGVLILLLTGCALRPPVAAPSATPETSPSRTSSAPTSITPTASGWFAGVRITPIRATLDRDRDVITVAVRAENTASRNVFEGGIDGITLDFGDEAPLGPPSASSVAVAHRTTRLDLVFPLRSGADVDLSRTALVLGGPDDESWRVPLKSRARATGIDPADIPASGSADANGFSFTAKRAQVLPWTCRDVEASTVAEPGLVWFDPVPKDQRGLLIWGDIRESQAIRGGDTLESASLTLPDGTTVPMIGDVFAVFDVGQSVPDFPLCFTVPSPVKGTYTVTWTSYRGATATLPITVSG